MFWNGKTAMDGLSGSGGALSASERRAGRASRGYSAYPPDRFDWLLNVLHLLDTKIHESHWQGLAYLIVHGPRDTHGPCVRQCLKPRSDVHALSEEVSGTDHYVADVNSNSNIDVLVGRNACVRLSESSLCRHCALYGVHRASELREDTVARRVRCGQDGRDETQKPDHSASLGDSITLSARVSFSVHTEALSIETAIESGALGRGRPFLNPGKSDGRTGGARAKRA